MRPQRAYQKINNKQIQDENRSDNKWWTSRGQTKSKQHSGQHKNKTIYQHSLALVMVTAAALVYFNKRCNHKPWEVWNYSKKKNLQSSMSKKIEQTTMAWRSQKHKF